MPDINVNKLSEALNTKADIDLNNTGVFSTSEGGGVNLTSSTPANANGKEVTTADFIKSDIQSNLLNYTTNRILEIPQDIKLELVDGTLTLKAGSKVYVPNGPDVFDEYIVQSDIIVTDTIARTLVLFVNNSGSNLFYDIRDVYSGSTQPSFGQFAAWYDTANNIVKATADGGSSWVTGLSLPICIATSASTNGFTSIDQVFNGFGYIGSTIFALSGIKCQFADGRNEDGSYKSYIKTTDKVLTKTFGSETINGFDCSLVCRNDTIDDLVWHVNEDFDNKSGYIVINKTEGIVKNLCPVFRFFINSSSDNGKISQFIPNPVDKLNWKSTELSGMSMPSNKYIDLTLGASGTTYTAPANGWFAFYCESVCDSRIVTKGSLFGNTALGKSGFANNNTVSVLKGEMVSLTYSTSTGASLRFYYCEGEN